MSFLQQLWFAWKLVLLQYRKQPLVLYYILYARCDLLENSYFCSIANNGKTWGRYPRHVVICLKTRTFAVSQTTSTGRPVTLAELWFAWKLVLLQYRKQPPVYKRGTGVCCDLLENSYFCSIANNDCLAACPCLSVVICLKTRTFAVSQTTKSTRFIVNIELWFAWKLVLLQYRKQHSAAPLGMSFRCDLLENSYFCSIANNLHLQLGRFFGLWFAWKLVLLQYRKQLNDLRKMKIVCCDLLENSYFCSIANNLNVMWERSSLVVICLKTRTFAVSQTTLFPLIIVSAMLWFAWKLVLLQYRKQHTEESTNTEECCDLLENSYFCSIANNFFQTQLEGIELWFAWKLVLLQYRKQLLSREDALTLVVICLKTRTFAVSQTTTSFVPTSNVALWFAWKLVLLQYRKQPYH